MRNVQNYDVVQAVQSDVIQTRPRVTDRNIAYEPSNVLQEVIPTVMRRYYRLFSIMDVDTPTPVRWIVLRRRRVSGKLEVTKTFSTVQLGVERLVKFLLVRFLITRDARRSPILLYHLVHGFYLKVLFRCCEKFIFPLMKWCSRNDWWLLSREYFHI